MKSFADLLIAWHAKSGRHHLPWQKSKDPYAVWVSEIMLQQTQVTTVIDYYNRFMKKFPTIKALAHADEEEVMQLWSGLGYYRRARFLHEGAQMIMDEMEGHFPSDFDMMMKIPGIGRSTAGAIAAFSFNQKKAILDGNVKRVLARYFLINEWTGLPKTEKELWGYAESLLPNKNIDTYTRVIYHRFKMPWPVSDRDDYCIQKLSKINANTFQLETKNITGSTYPLTACVRIPHEHSIIQVSAIDANHTHVEYALKTEPGGFLPAWAVNAMMDVGPYNTICNIRKIITHYNKISNAVNALIQ